MGNQQRRAYLETIRGRCLKADRAGKARIVEGSAPSVAITARMRRVC